MQDEDYSGVYSKSRGCLGDLMETVQGCIRYGAWCGQCSVIHSRSNPGRVFQGYQNARYLQALNFLIHEMMDMIDRGCFED